MKALVSVLALLVAACVSTPAPADRAALETSVAGFYAHYSSDDPGAADWDRPIYSARTAALIARWRLAVAEGELDGLESFGWLCECQDWNAGAFSARATAIRQLSADRARVTVALDAGWDAPVQQELDLVREQGRWLIDDLRSPSIQTSLRGTLQDYAR